MDILMSQKNKGKEERGVVGEEWESLVGHSFPSLLMNRNIKKKIINYNLKWLATCSVLNII